MKRRARGSETHEDTEGNIQQSRGEEDAFAIYSTIFQHWVLNGIWACYYFNYFYFYNSCFIHLVQRRRRHIYTWLDNTNTDITATFTTPLIIDTNKALSRWAGTNDGELCSDTGNFTYYTEQHQHTQKNSKSKRAWTILLQPPKIKWKRRRRDDK